MRRLSLSLVFVLAGFIAGLVPTGRMRTADDAIAQAPGAEPAASPAAVA